MIMVRSLKGSARPFFHPPGSHPSLGDHPLPSSAHTGALRRSLPASPPHRPTHVRTLFCQTLRGRRIPAAGPTFGSLTVPSLASQKKEPDLAMRSGSESTAACAAPCHIISIRSAPQQASLRGPQPSNRPERAPRRASRRAPPPRTPAPRWGRCRGCRAGRMPDRKESRA